MSSDSLNPNSDEQQISPSDTETDLTSPDTAPARADYNPFGLTAEAPDLESALVSGGATPLRADYNPFGITTTISASGSAAIADSQVANSANPGDTISVTIQLSVSAAPQSPGFNIGSREVTAVVTSGSATIDQVLTVPIVNISISGNGNPITRTAIFTVKANAPACTLLFGAQDVNGIFSTNLMGNGPVTIS